MDKSLPPLTQFILPSGAWRRVWWLAPETMPGAASAQPRSKACSRRCSASCPLSGAIRHLLTIDLYRNCYPALALAAGGLAAATLHMARSVCRRAERSVVPLVSWVLDGLLA